MRELKRCLILGAVVCTVVAFAGCDGEDEGLRGHVVEREPAGGIGPTIPDVKITFASEDGSQAKSVTSDEGGAYSVALDPARYTITATHPDYEDYSSVPGFAVVQEGNFGTCNVFLKEPRVTTVLLVRHADRGNDHLTAAGEARATELARVAWKAGVTAIYATNAIRTQQTVEPLRAALGIDATIWPLSADVNTHAQTLVEEVLTQHDGDVVLIAGHSDTVPVIIQKFGGPPNVSVFPEYDNLFVITHRPAGTEEGTEDAVNVMNLQYGVATPTELEAEEPSGQAMTTLLLVGPAETGAPGEERAQKLAHAAGKAGIAGIYALEGAPGPLSTLLQPLADTVGLTIGCVPPANIQMFLVQLFNDIDVGDTAVIAAQQPALSQIIEELGGIATGLIKPGERDNLFALTLCHDEEAKILPLQYGAPSP